jgi:lipopolysaccharide/colanic/teichoic acid biosynthesis glycosyltransferase
MRMLKDAVGLNRTATHRTIDLMRGVAYQEFRSPSAEVPTHAFPEQSWEPAPCDQQLELAAKVAARPATGYERLVKPVFDRVAAALVLILVIPVLVTIACGVLMTMGRPIFFRQNRIGRGGAPFAMLKFRTMRPDRRVADRPYPGPDRRVTHKSVKDPRHTTFGRWLRKLSLDELPQLVNVVRGDMSLVGPRPELAALAADYLDWQHARHTVKPGVTGLWQTTARGDGRLLHECVDIDLRYIHTLSFRRDLNILLRTPIAVLRTKGVI